MRVRFKTIADPLNLSLARTGQFPQPTITQQEQDLTLAHEERITDVSLGTDRHTDELLRRGLLLKCRSDTQRQNQCPDQVRSHDVRPAGMRCSLHGFSLVPVA
ncbi:MAG: hypothetical protein R3B96_16345 [Pirellulaceae bacterium]